MRLNKISISIAALVLFVLAGQTFAQADRGKTRDTATPIKDSKVTDDLDGTDDQYFYKFTAGAGTVKIKFEVEAAETNAGATFEVYDSKTRPLLSNILVQGVDKGTEEVVKSIKLTKQQDIIIRVKGIKYGESGGRGTYTITIDGAVEKGEKPAQPDNKDGNINER